MMRTGGIVLIALVLLLQAAEHHFGYELFEEHGAVMLLIDPDSGAIVDANHAARAFYGYSREQLRTMSIQEINTLSPEQVAAEWRHAAEQNRNYFHFRHRTATGEVHDVEVFSWPVSFGDRELLFSIIQDVTDREVAQEAVLHYSRQLEDLVELRTDALMAQQNRFQRFLWGAIALQALVIAGLIYNIRRRKQAETKLKAILTDQSRQIQEAVKKSRQQADIIADQQRHQALSELLVNLAHQWRQPLNAAGVLIQDLEDAYDAGELSKETMQQQTSLAFSQLKNLSATLDRFAELYEYQGGKEPLALKAACQEVLSLMALRIKAQQVQLKLEIDPAHTVCVARRDLIEVLLKLVANTLEVAQARKIEAPMLQFVSYQDEQQCHLEINDNAGGIEEGILKRLFEPYQTTAFKEPGKGLSLYLIHQLIVERYRGAVQVQNITGGAQVRISLPIHC